MLMHLMTNHPSGCQLTQEGNAQVHTDGWVMSTIAFKYQDDNDANAIEKCTSLRIYLAQQDAMPASTEQHGLMN